MGVQKIWLYFFAAVYIVSGIVSWKNIYSLLPIIGVLMTTVAYWIRDAAVTRKLVVPASIFWLIYSIAVFSIPGIITEAFILVSVITAIIRYDIRKEPILLVKPAEQPLVQAEKQPLVQAKEQL